MNPWLLEILCCPVSKIPLQLLNKAQLTLLNQAIKTSHIQTTNGAIVTQPLSQGLLTIDGNLVYRIEDDIPVMLADEAISTLQFPGFSFAS